MIPVAYYLVTFRDGTKLAFTGLEYISMSREQRDRIAFEQLIGTARR